MHWLDVDFVGVVTVCAYGLRESVAAKVRLSVADDGSWRLGWKTGDGRAKVIGGDSSTSYADQVTRFGSGVLGEEPVLPWRKAS